MVPKNVLIAGLCATAAACSGVAVADEYAADEFLGLDLSTAVVSPKPLGPAASFTPGPLDVTVAPRSNRAQVIAEPRAEPKAVAERARVAHPLGEPRLVARTKIARRHRNPLDAQALDAASRSGLASPAVSATGSDSDNWFARVFSSGFSMTDTRVTRVIGPS